MYLYRIRKGDNIMSTNAVSVSQKTCSYDLFVSEIVSQRKAYILFQKADDLLAIKEAIQELVPQLKILGANEVFVSSKDISTTLPEDEFYVNNVLFHYDHQMKRLILSPMKKATPEKTPGVTLLPLTASLAKDYLKIYNEGFYLVPNSALYTVEDITRMMYSPSYEGGVVQINGANGGVYELSYTEEVPEVASVALASAYRGKGYGKKVFRSALYKLEQKGFNEAFVQVSTKNIEALSLYIELGFEEESTLSVWYKAIV